MKMVHIIILIGFYETWYYVFEGPVSEPFVSAFLSDYRLSIISPLIWSNSSFFHTYWKNSIDRPRPLDCYIEIKEYSGTLLRSIELSFLNSPSKVNETNLLWRLLCQMQEKKKKERKNSKCENKRAEYWREIFIFRLKAHTTYESGKEISLFSVGKLNWILKMR